MKKIRMVDVAAHAGVSKSTVSQFLNGRLNYMSAETQARIADTIKALDYVPNPIARSLKSDKSKTIGVIVRDIAGFDSSRILRGIDDLFKQHDYNVFIYNTDFDAQSELRALQSLKAMQVDGILISSSGKNLALISQYIENGLPLVQFQLEYDDCPAHIVRSDYRQAAFQATEHLIQLGHRRICFMTQTFQGIPSRNERYLGYREALAQYDIAFDERLIQYWDRETGLHQPLQETLNTLAPSALFSQHLAISHDLITQLKKLDITLGSDLSLIGFDDIPMVEHFKVPITVVKQDPYRVGVESAQLLLASINKQISTLQKITVPCELVVRESCVRLD